MKDYPVEKDDLFIPVLNSEEIEQVEALAREIWTEHYTPMIGSAQVEYMLDRFQSQRAVAEQLGNGALYFLVRENGIDIGYLAVQPKERELFLSKIYVLSSHRKKGYGRKSLQFVEALAKERGLDRITLTVNKYNTRSIRAYERFGFVIERPIVQDIGNGFVMDDYLMIKIVA